MRDWGDISDTVDFDPNARDSADCTIATEADAADVNINAVQTVFALSDFESFLGGDLGGISRAFFATTEAVSKADLDHQTCWRDRECGELKVLSGALRGL